MTPSDVSTASAPLRPKVGKNVFGCAVVFVGTLLLMIAALGAFVAKTGIVHVPLLSALYHGPTPTRLVAARPMTTDAFRVLLGARFFNQALAARSTSTAAFPKEFHVRVTEKELTSVVMNAVDVALRSGSWRQQYAQLVVRPTDVEVFGQFESGPYHIDLLVRFIPHVTTDGITFEPSTVQIGDISLPPALAYRAMSYVFARDLGTWSGAFGSARIRDIQLSDGVIELIATP